MALRGGLGSWRAGACFPASEAQHRGGSSSSAPARRRCLGSRQCPPAASTGTTGTEPSTSGRQTLPCPAGPRSGSSADAACAAALASAAASLGRTAAAVALSTLLTLGSSLPPPPLAPAAAASTATALLAPAASTVPATAIQVAAAAAAPSAGTAAADADAPPVEAAAAAPSPAVRFTGPEVLASLPPLPTEFPALPELRLPRYSTYALPNGLRVFLLPDNEVPLVRATLLMRGGQYGSPPDKVGTATLAAYVQRAGGSVAHPVPHLDERLEELAASVELGAGAQAVSADLTCLSEDVEEVMQLMAEVVRTPAFPPEKLELYRAQLLNALEHQNDSPTAIARRKLTKLLYGADSIYARTPSKASVNAIRVTDLASYAAAWERPDAAVLGVVGAFEPERMRALVEEAFGGWAPAEGQPPAPPPVPRGLPPALPPAVAAAAGLGAGVGISGAESEDARGARPPVFLVDRPGLTQASVAVGEPGIALSDPDVFALDVLGGALNSFGGTLFDTLRSREGLAYSVSGSWDSPPDHPGLFLGGGQTSSPGEFLRSLRTLLAAAAADPPSEAELAAAQSETLNSFAFNFSSTASQLQRILVYDLLGLPQDYLFQYFRGIEDVTRPDVARAAAAHLHPVQQAVVVVGDRDVAGPSLEGAGFEVVPMRLDD